MLALGIKKRKSNLLGLTRDVEMPVTEDKTTPENPSKAKILPSWRAGRTSDLLRAPDGALNWYW